MKRPLYQPWRKGPATIIPFTGTWCRAWIVRHVDDQDFYGELVGPEYDGERLTETGSHAVVLEILKRPQNRQGLPIVQSWRAAQ